jgi:hypothetical protein
VLPLSVSSELRSIRSPVFLPDPQFVSKCSATALKKEKRRFILHMTVIFKDSTIHCLGRYEVMTQSPDLEEDKVSQSSTDSRRQSEAPPPSHQLEQPQVRRG